MTVDLSNLTYSQREIIKLRCGGGDGHVYTRKEVARIFRATIGRIRSLEGKALKKLGRTIEEIREIGT